jgi:hypothetical protein
MVRAAYVERFALQGASVLKLFALKSRSRHFWVARLTRLGTL